MKKVLLVTIIVGVLGITACGAEPTTAPAPLETPTARPSPTSDTFDSPLTTPDTFESPVTTPDTFESPIGMPNPASKFCEEQGYKLELRTDAAGTTGYCLFPDGSECEEWAFYRGECAPGTPGP